MIFKQTEKEFIKAIIKYGGKVKSLAEVINKSHLLEDRGIAVVLYNQNNHIFLSKKKYNFDSKEPLGYISEIVSLINSLIEKRLIIIIPLVSDDVLVIGREQSRYGNKMDTLVVDEREIVEVGSDMFNWRSTTGEQIYWPISCPDSVIPFGKIFNYWFTVSQELKDLVKHKFKTEEERRFSKQQRLMWISIFVALFIGLLGIFF